MKNPQGRHRGPVDRQRLPQNRRYITPIQRRILKAFAGAGGLAIVATGGRHVRCEPGEVLAPLSVWSVIREHRWVAPFPGGDLGRWRLTEAGKLAQSRGWYVPMSEQKSKDA